MQSPKYIESNPVLIRDLKIRFNSHLKRLHAIQQRPLHHSAEKRVSPSRVHHSPDRQFDIRLENKVLFEKLVSIQEGSCRVATTPVRMEPRSLNQTVRQRELEKIAEENSQFAKRLVRKEAYLSRKKLDLEYSQACKYRELISKTVLQAKRKSKGVTLQMAA